MRDQLSAYRTSGELDQRPWVSLDNIKITGPLFHDAIGAGWPGDDRWHISLAYQMKNHGKSPATHVVFWASMVPDAIRNRTTDVRRDDLKNDLDATCKTNEVFRFISGHIVFPGEILPIGSFDVTGEEKVFKRAKIALWLNEYAGFFIISTCVTYGSTFGEVSYRTGQNFRLRRADKTMIDLSKGTVNETELVLEPLDFQGSDAK